MIIATITLSNIAAIVLALSCVMVGVALGIFVMGWPYEGGWDRNDF